jgi:hypothetical protein
MTIPSRSCPVNGTNENKERYNADTAIFLNNFSITLIIILFFIQISYRICKFNDLREREVNSSNVYLSYILIKFVMM